MAFPSGTAGAGAAADTRGSLPPEDTHEDVDDTNDATGEDAGPSIEEATFMLQNADRLGIPPETRETLRKFLFYKRQL